MPTAYAAPSRKTHDLDEPAEQVTALRPDLAAVVRPLRPRTTWGFAFRYPNTLGLAEAVPETAEIAATVTDIRELRGRLAVVLVPPSM